jgi:hypothetical protein
MGGEAEGVVRVARFEVVEVGGWRSRGGLKSGG